MIKLFKKSFFKRPEGMEKTLQTTDGKITIRIPTILDDVTLGQLMEMQEKPDLDDMEAISILSGIPRETLLTVKNFDDLQVFSQHVGSLAIQIKYLYYSNGIPQKVTFVLNDNEVTVGVMNNLSIEPAGAFLAARDIIADEIKKHIDQYGEDDWSEHFQPSLNACCHILAHYFYCRATGKKYDEYEAEQFCEEIKKMRVTEYLDRYGHIVLYEGLLPMLVYFTFARFIEADAIHYTATGPVIKHHDNADALSPHDVTKLVQQHRSVANAHANEVEKFLRDHKADFPLWQFNPKNRSSRQAGPRIRSIDKTVFNYPGDNYASNYLPINEFLN